MSKKHFICILRATLLLLSATICNGKEADQIEHVEQKVLDLTALLKGKVLTLHLRHEYASQLKDSLLSPLDNNAFSGKLIGVADGFYVFEQVANKGLLVVVPKDAILIMSVQLP